MGRRPFANWYSLLAAAAPRQGAPSTRQALRVHIPAGPVVSGLCDSRAVRIRRQDENNVLIAVRDTGIGIAAQDQAAVFEEFRQVGRNYTNKQEGTGLGSR